MRRFRAVKASIIIGIFLISIFAAFLPYPVPAPGLFQGNIDLTYDSEDVPNTIRPETDLVSVDCYISHFVSGLGSRLVIPFFNTNTVPIELSVGETPDWLIASVSPGVVYPFLGIQKSDRENVKVSISLTPNAPAFQTYTVRLIANHRDIPPVRGSTNSIEIPIKSGFYSNYQYEYKTFDEIGAGETVTFPITITGYSNARSRIIFEVVNPPDGWSPSINSEFFLGTTALDEDATGTVNFMIQAPMDFGYHNEVQQFNVRVQTMAAGHVEAGIDNTTTLQFTVRARGFSTPGFEVTFTLVILMAIVVIYRRSSKK
jgi:hypothetical protein